MNYARLRAIASMLRPLGEEVLGFAEDEKDIVARINLLDAADDLESAANNLEQAAAGKK